MTNQATPGAPRTLAARLTAPWLVGPLLFICILSGYLLSYNVDKPTHNADWYIRYQVACSIVERNAFYIHPYDGSQRTGPGIDGHDYSQYTLGQTTALIPLYLLGRVFAGLPHTDCDTTIAPPLVFLTTKLLDPILGALLCVLFFATVRLLGYAPRTALTLTLILAFGTALWPDVLSNLEHTMESLFLLAAAYAALRYTLARRGSRLWVVTMGVAAGLVFVTRVAGLIAIPIFALYLVVLHRRRQPAAWKRPLLRDLGLYVLGVLPSCLVNAAFDMLRFGSPLRTGPYPDQSFGYPPWLGIPNLLISPGKGLLWYVPVLFLLPFVARPFWRRFPLPAILFGLICGFYLLFYANVNYWHGDPAWGPRYLYAVLPYLILPLGELLRRWRGYRLVVRGLIVGTLAASFLVQFSAVSVSYWRHWDFIYGYHYAQVENHSWGQNLNYWWAPDQSPIYISLSGIYAITQKYVEHAPLLQHPAELWLSNPYETSIYQIYGQAAVYISSLEQFNNVYNWNTFTMWWVHTYPWWNKATVIRLALALLAVFLASGGALLAVLTAAARSRRSVPIAGASDDAIDGALISTVGANDGSSNGHTPAAPRDIVVVPQLAPALSTPVGSGGSATLMAQAPTVQRVAVQAQKPAPRPASGLVPLGLAACVAALAYGGIVGVAAMQSPRQAPPLIHTASMNATVSDGNWAYRVLGVTSVRALPGGLDPPAAGHHYAVVTLRLRNLSTRPNSLRLESFSLTDSAGLTYPRVYSLLRPVAALYHLMPAGSVVPARSALDSAMVFLVRDGARHLEMLGPNITLIRLW